MTSTAIREEKAAVIAEVRGKLEAADAAIVTEYRGMSVTALATLRRELRNAGAEYKVYKNTLARFAVREAGLEALEEFLTGPTAIAFVKGDAQQRQRLSATKRRRIRFSSSRVASLARLQ